MENIQIGCVDIWLDQIVPCLKDIETGEIKETVVFGIQSRSYLREFREDNGWKINWADIPKDVEVFALSLKDRIDIQGLVGLRRDEESKAVYLHWACTAPHNNIHDFGKQKYSGVGGHLFAIAADMSFRWGFDGFVYGYALNKELLNHYIEVLECSLVGVRHPYHFMLDPTSAKKLMEIYTYEWNG